MPFLDGCQLVLMYSDPWNTAKFTCADRRDCSGQGFFSSYPDKLNATELFTNGDFDVHR